MNGELPMVSVNMPVYNGEKYVAGAIESVLAQTYPNFELIIVNDGSTDGTARVINSYTDPRIRLFNNPGNLGLSAARNRAIEASRGKYIAILDSDDVALPIRLAEQVTFLEANPDFGMVGSWVQPTNANGTPTESVWELPAAPEQIPLILLFHNYFVQSAVLLRKSALPAPCYRHEFPPAEDYDLWVRIARNHKVWNLPQVLVQYRQHATNISREKAEQMRQSENCIVSGQLSQLGMEVPEAELQLHKKLLPETPQVYAHEAVAVHHWLNRISENNKIRRIYNQHHLQAFLTEIWQKHSGNLLNYDRNLLAILLSSPFVHFKALSTIERIKLTIKCNLQWKTRI